MTNPLTRIASFSASLLKKARRAELVGGNRTKSQPAAISVKTAKSDPVTRAGRAARGAAPAAPAPVARREADPPRGDRFAALAFALPDPDPPAGSTVYVDDYGYGFDGPAECV